MFPRQVSCTVSRVLADRIHVTLMVNYRRLMRHWSGRAIAVGCASLSVLSGSLRAATPEQINEAIANGVAYIYSQQKPEGRWEPDDHRDGLAHDFKTVGARMQGDTWGGFSSIAVYALLSAGESPSDKRIVAAVNFLKHADVVGIYALGMRAQVWQMLATSSKERLELRDVIQADANRIIAGVNQTGPSEGLWYYGDGHGAPIDHSVSQFGILGLWALQESGAEVPTKAWTVFEQVWRSHQFPDGGWAYNATPDIKGRRGNVSETPAMTAAGVATLFIIEDNVDPNTGNEHKNISNSNIELGLKWMAAHIGEVGTTDTDKNYTWYGVQRIGVASGTKYFGTTDWFKVGADQLIGRQLKNGSWASGSYGNPLSETSLAVLFLSRGKAPVMMNKLQYEVLGGQNKLTEANWNERPRDVANLAHWTGEQIENNLNWQSVTLDVPAEELRDAPILYISGDQELRFNDEQIAKLKRFIEAGGLILGNANFDSRPFSESFQKLGTQMFGYEFRALEPESPIWKEQYHLTQQKTPLAGMSNGDRELMLLMDRSDPGRAWQRILSSDRMAPYELGANIFLYAVDKKNLEERGSSPVVLPDPKITNTKSISVVRVDYGHNWDPEPGGWRRLSAIFHNTLGMDLQVNPAKLGESQLTPKSDTPTANAPKPMSDAEIRTIAFKRIPSAQVLATDGDPAKLDALLKPKIAEVKKEQAAAAAAANAAVRDSAVKLAAMTGTTAFTLSDDQIAELRSFINAGGTLVIDAAGGASQFAASAEIMLHKLCPDSCDTGLATPLPPDDPLYTLPGGQIMKISFRSFARQMLGTLREGRVFGIKEKGRVVVYYSKEDLSAGLVGEPVDGIVGYTPDVATEIMRNITLLADGQKSVTISKPGEGPKPAPKPERRRGRHEPAPAPAPAPTPPPAPAQ